jgi:hypothetical protein
LTEQQFNFDDYANGFYKADVLHCYVQLLSEFDTNSTVTNTHLVSMLHKVSGYGLMQMITRLSQVATNDALCPLLYSAQLFCIARRAHAPAHRYNTSLQPVYDLCRFVIGQFLRDVHRVCARE